MGQTNRQLQALAEGEEDKDFRGRSLGSLFYACIIIENEYKEEGKENDKQ
ncbi:hypothetical protein SAMN05660297_00736 [Natronincola peptidivorans]|uniref:Uncharacterized protein n=1 Tax=Natronincola peptidivorans TaxID=426128 RepID=A0A1H9ZUT8_9FIRM|nr:hypothetical protein SAMN05660297_00736 [Natronincola peptidivorans]